VGLKPISVPTGYLQCFDAVGWVIWPVKIVPEMTYKVSSGTLNLCSLTLSSSCAVCSCAMFTNDDWPLTAACYMIIFSIKLGSHHLCSCPMFTDDVNRA